MQRARVVVAGATGNLGGRIVAALLARGGVVRAIVRPGSAAERVAALRTTGAEVIAVDFGDARALAGACAETGCVVSALSGLDDVIVEAQTRLLDAAVAARVPRFIPSDYAIDFTKLADGSNRNLDLRRRFHRTLERAPIAATSILCGMFSELLTGQAPVILFRFKRVMYWGDAEQRLDFTTMEDAATFTAAAALDSTTPRFLRIAGDSISARGLKVAATEVTGETFKLFRAGGVRRLERLIRIMRTVFPAPDTLYPPWQGMQYLHNMFAGGAVLDPLDNARYPELRWTPIREVLAAYQSQRD